MAGNLLVFHGGAPTAVMNASLAAVLDRAEAAGGQVGRILAARGGSGALLRRDFLDLRQVSAQQRRRLPYTPASAIHSSRDPLEAEDYQALVEVLRQEDIRYVLVNGGNGSMDCCGRLEAACREARYEAYVIGIPKTIDNDLALTDHAPGFGSCARYMAASTAELCCDVDALPIHVSVLEAMGRSAGWLAASASLAEEIYGQGPDFIYTPERVFDQERFLEDVAQLIARKGRGVIVVSEGLHDATGASIVPPLMRIGRATYFGDVSTHLAQLIIRELGYKARSEKPGILGRASSAWQSSVDREEAWLVGAEAVKAALSGETAKMVALRRLPGEDYRVETWLAPIAEVMLTERLMPQDFLNASGNQVSPAFKDWCRPLLGPLPERLAELF